MFELIKVGRALRARRSPNESTFGQAIRGSARTECAPYLSFTTGTGDFHHRVKRGFGLPFAVEQQRIAAATPGVGIGHAPKSHEVNVLAMLEEHLEQLGVLIGQFLLYCINHSVGGRLTAASALSVLRNIRALIAL